MNSDDEMKKEFNGYEFNDKETRKKMKFIVVTRGDLDINNCYAFENRKELKSYLRKNNSEVYAVFEIKDMTNKNDN